MRIPLEVRIKSIDAEISARDYEHDLVVNSDQYKMGDPAYVTWEEQLSERMDQLSKKKDLLKNEGHPEKEQRTLLRRAAKAKRMHTK